VFAIAALGVAGATWTMLLRLSSDLSGDQPGLQAALLDWIILTYVFSGLVAWWRRPDSRFGPLLIAGGLITSLSSLSSASGALPFTIGQTLDLIPFAVFLHVYLAFPSGRLEGRAERALVATAYFIAIGLQLVGMLFGGFRPDNVLAIFQEPGFAFDLFKVQLVALAATMLAGIVVLIVRRHEAGRPPRRSAGLLFDAFALALAMSAVMLTVAAFEWSGFLTIQRLTFFFLGLAPVGFLAALLDARLARSSVGELLVELRADSSPSDLRAPLARALHDPGLEVAYWLPEFGAWADPDGRPFDLERAADGRAVRVIERDGENVAALIHSPALEDETELLDGVSAAASIALENGRLHAELKAKLEELADSRGRVIAAGQDERKRLERNLHDGAQQRLIALSLELSRLGARLGEDPDSRAQIDAARAEIAVSLDELRDVARGLHPAVLSGHGLEVALQSLAATSTVPVKLTVELRERLSEPVEVAAYYVVSESLANVGKHAEARSATVGVARREGMLVVEVVDDGVGGADSERGSGLRGLADRVEALGGRLRVWTPLGEGTTVRAEVPCA
jgi:signal transduction histidine kinase